MTLRESRNARSCLLMRCFIILLIIGRCDNGRQFPGLYTSPFFRTGVTIECFHAIGKTPLVIEVIKITVKALITETCEASAANPSQSRQ